MKTATQILMDSLNEQGTFFDVEEKPVTVGGKVFPGKKGIVRADDGTPLGIVSKTYPTTTNGAIFEKFGKALDRSKIDLDGATAEVKYANHGARTMVTFRFPAHKIAVKVDDVAELQIVCRNSYDGRWKFSVLGGALRIACLNGMLLGDWIAAYSEYHNANLNLDHAANKIISILGAFQGTEVYWKKMLAAKITDEVAWRVICKYTNRADDFKRGLVAFREAERKNVATSMFEQYEAREKKEIGANAFGIYNTMTHHATHAKLTEGKEAVSASLRMAKVQDVLASKYWRERVLSPRDGRGAAAA